MQHAVLQQAEASQRRALGQHRGNDPADGEVMELVPRGDEITPLAEQYDQNGDAQRHADHVAGYGSRAAPRFGCREIIGHRFKLTTAGGKTR